MIELSHTKMNEELTIWIPTCQSNGVCMGDALCNVYHKLPRTSAPLYTRKQTCMPCKALEALLLLLVNPNFYKLLCPVVVLEGHARTCPFCSISFPPLIRTGSRYIRHTHVLRSVYIVFSLLICPFVWQRNLLHMRTSSDKPARYNTLSNTKPHSCSLDLVGPTNTSKRV